MIRNIFIEQLQQGEQPAISSFVKDNQDAVYRTCLAYVQNYHDAADLTQNVFINAFERINQYKGDAKISTWLIRIAINLSKNFLRDNKKRLLQTDVSEINISIEQDKNLFGKETRKAVRKAIFKLQDKQRKVFILHFYLELSYKEIAEVTGYSISSVESLLFRARQKLKGLLQEFYNENLE